jgi:hypothetical protein
MKSNKLIAEFMGFPKQQDAVDDRTIAYYIGDVIKADNRHNENEDDVFHPDDMQFHKSWEWLMPVVEKIESLGYTFEKNFQRIDKDYQCLIVKGNDILYQEFNTDSRIACYQVVVKFINEYNKTDE